MIHPILQIVVHLGLAGLLQLVLPFIGGKVRDFNYSDIDGMLTDSYAFNLAFRVFAAPVFIILFSTVSHIFEIGFLSNGIWMVSVYYFFLNLVIVLNTRGYLASSVISRVTYFFAHAVSISLSFFVYSKYIQFSAESLLPDPNDFKTEIWLLVIFFLFSVLNKIQLPTSDFKGFEKMAVRKYQMLDERFSKILNPKIENYLFLKVLFFSIAIYEDQNRNVFMRFLERIFFRFLKNKTTGIMQIANTKRLSDEESILLAQDLFLQNISALEKIDADVLSNVYHSDIARRLVAGFNTQDYARQVCDIFYIILLNIDPPKNFTKADWLIVQSEIAVEAYDYAKYRKILIAILKNDPLNEYPYECFFESDPLRQHLSPDVNELLFIKSILQSSLEKVSSENKDKLISKISLIDSKIQELDRRLVNPLGNRPTI